jgi:hypothetical protein
VVGAVLAEDYLSQTPHNALFLRRPKLLFPVVPQEPQSRKNHNRCCPENYCTGLTHGPISSQGHDSLKGLDVMGSYQDFYP